MKSIFRGGGCVVHLVHVIHVVHIVHVHVIHVVHVVHIAHVVHVAIVLILILVLVLRIISTPLSYPDSRAVLLIIMPRRNEPSSYNTPRSVSTTISLCNYCAM